MDGGEDGDGGTQGDLVPDLNRHRLRQSRRRLVEKSGSAFWRQQVH